MKDLFNMKRLFTLSAVLLATLGMIAEPVDIEKAKQVASSLMDGNAEPVLVSQAVRAESKMRRVNAKTQMTAPYYIFSRGEGKGFVIVSGDDCLPSILGYTESGDYDESQLPPHFFQWLNHYKTIIEDAQVAGENVSRESTQRRVQNRAKGWASIAPLLTSHWHQTSPYNDRCPFIPGTKNRAVCGCVATAAAQVIYYYRKDNPETFNANTPTYGTDEWHQIAVTEPIKKGTPLKWGLMLDSYPGGEPADCRSAVADLVYGIGTMAKMGYSADGSGAQIYDLVPPMKSFFNLSSEYVSKGNMSTASWEKMIYDDLAQGHPIVYSGHNDKDEGHAVVLDGYQSSTGLFHFNYGWGGQGDGYFTVDDETGMNGYPKWAEMTYKIHPLKPNLTVSIVPPVHVYANVENEFTVKVENNSTFDFQGIYLFASASNSKPAKLSNAKSSDKTTVVATGETVELKMTAKPTNDRDWYITVTDGNLNVLEKITVTPEITTANIHFKSLSLDGSIDKETFDGKDFQVVYNDKTMASATLTNASDIAFDGTLRLNIYVYDEATKQWKEVGDKFGKIAIAGKSEGPAEFNLTSTSSCPLEVGKYYMGKLDESVSSSDDKIQFDVVADTPIRFVLKDNNMEVVGFENTTMKLKGNFDNTAFNTATFANKSSYRSATIYDLTQCAHINVVSQTVNPNALIYVADDSQATGLNVIRAGKCANLSLVAGCNFTPRADFVAEKAQINIMAEPAQWVLLTSPFEVVVPDGIIAREILEHSVSGITNGTRDVHTLEAGKTYLLMTSSSKNVVMKGENVKVLASPVANVDPAVVGTYVNSVTPADAQLIENSDKPSFVPVDEETAVEAMRGYWYASDLTKSFRAYPSLTLDPAYVLLAQNIELAYQQLDKYQALTKRDAYRAYLAKIQEAEHEFSYRGEDETTLTSSTQVKNYAAQLLDDGITYMHQIARLNNQEIDFTSNIVNPSFETNSTKGWTVEKKDGSSAGSTVNKGTGANQYRAVGLDGEYVFRSLFAKADSTSASISQVVEGLTPGYYRLTAKVGTDPESTVTIFAGDATATVNGHAFGSLYLTTATIDDILVEAPEGAETGSLTIGVKEGRWYKADDFQLTYVKTIKDIDEGPDAIIDVVADDAVKPSQTRSGIYTMQGLKVSQMTTPGIYIVNGKRVLKR